MIPGGRKGRWILGVVVGLGVLFLLVLLAIRHEEDNAEGSFLSRREALAHLDEWVTKGRQRINDPGMLSGILEDVLGRVGDHPKVYALYVEIVEKSENPACVWLALKYFPQNPSLRNSEARRLDRIHQLSRLATHPSRIVQLQVAEVLSKTPAPDQARSLFLSLAALPKWQVDIEREAPAFLKAGWQSADSLKYEWVIGVVHGLLAENDWVARDHLRTAWDTYGMHAFLESFLAQRPSEYRKSIQGFYKQVEERLRHE
jgi:hypothetical protein